jgi:hypothetical protein
MLNMERNVFFPVSFPASSSEVHPVPALILLPSPALFIRFRCPVGYDSFNAQWFMGSIAVEGGLIDVTDVGCIVIIMTAVGDDS